MSPADTTPPRARLAIAADTRATAKPIAARLPVASTPAPVRIIRVAAVPWSTPPAKRAA